MHPVARKGRRGWSSKDCADTSLNLLGDDRLLKYNSLDAERAWWIAVLSRGMLHIEPLPECPGETPAGAAYAVSKLNGILRQRFPNVRKPRVVGTDRGVGFFHVCGKITTEYSEALRSQGMRAMQGEDARAQPGKMGDALHTRRQLHGSVQNCNELRRRSRGRSPGKIIIPGCGKQLAISMPISTWKDYAQSGPVALLN